MKKLVQAYQIINILSIDVVAGAMICASFFASIFDVDILSQGMISLGLTVWIIYTADHLLDARKIKQTASTERHRFHQRYFKILSALLVLAMLVDATQILFIRKQVFIEGFLLALIVGIYFLVQQRLNFLKEFIGALLYTGGVLLIPFSMKKDISIALIILITQFGLIAWINLLLFSLFDRQRDSQDRHSSFATTFEEKTTHRVLIALFVFCAILIIFQLSVTSFETKAMLTIALMNAVLLLIFLKKDYFEKEDRYRLLGDAVFLFPLIYILI